jgi:tetratricopeptide (TPR) repeat protein
MNNPVAKTKADELVERAISLGRETEPSGLAVAAIKRDALREKGNSPAQAYMVLGMAAAMEWNIDGLHEDHKKAILFSNTSWARLNYAASLTRVGLFQEATDEFFRASEQEPENISSLMRAIVSATVAGLFQRAKDATATLVQRGGEMDGLIEGIGESAESISGMLANLGVSDAEYIRTQELAFAVLRENKTRYNFTHTTIGHDPDDNNVYVQIGVFANSSKVIEMECELAVRLSDALPDWHADKLIFAFIPLQ